MLPLVTQFVSIFAEIELPFSVFYWWQKIDIKSLKDNHVKDDVEIEQLKPPREGRHNFTCSRELFVFRNYMGFYCFVAVVVLGCFA